MQDDGRMAPFPDDMEDLDRPLTVREFREFRVDLEARFATKDDLKAFATKEDLKAFATKDDLKATRDELRDELRRHIDMMVENFRTEFKNLYDWTVATTNGLDTRTGALETRVTRLETRRRK